MLDEDCHSKIQLINKDLDSNNLESALLRTIEIASKYNHQKVVDWANLELGGYQKDVPSYRMIKAEYRKHGFLSLFIIVDVFRLVIFFSDVIRARSPDEMSFLEL